MKCKDCSRTLPKKGRNGSKPVRCKVCGLISSIAKVVQLPKELLLPSASLSFPRLPLRDG